MDLQPIIEAAREDIRAVMERDGVPGVAVVLIEGGQPVFPLSIEKRNGYIYVGGMRATQHLPGLFFSADGEALDLRGTLPTIRNILLHRSKAQASMT